jgi:diacylglycerol kinase
MILSSKFIRNRNVSFRNAFNGIIHGFVDEINFKIHLFFTILAVLLSVILKISLTEWCLIIIVIGMVWSTELINTAIERAVDLYTLEKHPLAKQSKDIAAGAVLISAITSVMIGVIIFLPKILIQFF